MGPDRILDGLVGVEDPVVLGDEDRDQLSESPELALEHGHRPLDGLRRPEHRREELLVRRNRPVGPVRVEREVRVVDADAVHVGPREPEDYAVPVAVLLLGADDRGREDLRVRGFLANGDRISDHPPGVDVRWEADESVVGQALEVDLVADFPVDGGETA